LRRRQILTGTVWQGGEIRIRGKPNEEWLVGVAAGLWLATHAQAAVLSFNGSFTKDDDQQFLSFTQGALSPVTLQTSSYAAGGFDPIVAVFDAKGLLIAQNDDGVGVTPDPSTGAALDSLLTVSLGAGQYIISLTEFLNFAFGPTLVMAL
jgi:hypothetical protein